jgi:integrase
MRHLDLDGFCTWMTDERGRDPRTATLYSQQIRLALEHAGGPLGRLLRGELAPKSKRVALAALRAYALYTEDGALVKKLQNVKLPAAVRQKVQYPLATVQWLKLLKAIGEATYLTEPVRCVLGCVAVRGFRTGDVLRIGRDELLTALKTGVLSSVTKGARRKEFGTKLYLHYLQPLARYPNWEHLWDLVSPGAKFSSRYESALKRIERSLRVVGQHIGMPIEDLHPHRLRRTFAVNFLAQVGGDLVKLTQVMQWADVKTAFGYVDHERRKELDEVAEQMFEKH